MLPSMENVLSNTPLFDAPPKATVDFETRSACDLKAHGAWVYSEHKTTEVMCLAFRLPYWPEGRTELWHPAYPHLGIEEEGWDELQELFGWIELGGLVEAHNAFFEQCIWINVCVARMGWPAVPSRQWRCSAAKCSANSLPRDLARAAAAMDSPYQKDMGGKAVMLRLCKPRKALKKERAAMAEQGIDPDATILWRESVEDFQFLWDYCRTDVLAEESLSHQLPDLSPHEQRIWYMDQDMNQRGMLCDLALVRSALRIAAAYRERMTRELVDITGGEVVSPTGRAKFKDWMQRQGVPLPNTQGPTLDKFTAMKGMKPHLHRAIYIFKELNKTSTAKYQAMLDRVSRDGRLRDLMMYWGAGTGRWAGKGVQVHNFPKGSISDIDAVCAAILTGEWDWVQCLYGDVMEALSGALRGALWAPEGRELIVADFAAIEARVVLWLARQMDALDVFYRGDCIYCDMSTGIYGYKVVKGVHKSERQFGKQAILGLGFEMGFAKFLATCRKYKITFTREMAERIVASGGGDWGAIETAIRRYFAGDKRRLRTLEDLELTLDEAMHELVLMKYTVDTYRNRYPEVAQMWRDQEAAAIAAVRDPGRRVECQRGRNSWVVEGRFLRTYLPSGRPLTYVDPKLSMRPLPWDKTQKRAVLTFMGVDALTKQWVRQETYGGKLVENITQATARDLMADAMVAADDHPLYDVGMSVHDELVCEVDEGVGDVGEFERMMSETPLWADGCPVEAEGWRGKRYRK